MLFSYYRQTSFKIVLNGIYSLVSPFTQGDKRRYTGVRVWNSARRGSCWDMMLHKYVRVSAGKAFREKSSGTHLEQ